jgi:hypothetical protein
VAAGPVAVGEPVQGVVGWLVLVSIQRKTAMAAVLPASVRSRSQCGRRSTADRGQVRPDAASPLVAEVGVAMVVQRFLVDGPPVPDLCVGSVLDEVVLPPQRPSSAGAPVDPGATRSCRG